MWVRGHPADYDAWRDQGNPGWGFTDLLPAFKAIEDNAAGANHWRGAGGPLHVTDCAAQTHPLTRRYLEAARQAGLPLNPDFNGESQEGVGVYQITTRHGRRMSAARAFSTSLDHEPPRTTRKPQTPEVQAEPSAGAACRRAACGRLGSSARRFTQPRRSICIRPWGGPCRSSQRCCRSRGR